jgi:hypothetical protein
LIHPEVRPHHVARGVELLPDAVDEFPPFCRIVLRCQVFAELMNPRHALQQPPGVHGGQLSYQILKIKRQAGEPELPVFTICAAGNLAGDVLNPRIGVESRAGRWLSRTVSMVACFTVR